AAGPWTGLVRKSVVRCRWHARRLDQRRDLGHHRRRLDLHAGIAFRPDRSDVVVAGLARLRRAARGEHMNKAMMQALAAMAAATLLSACQTVQTTAGGEVGVSRNQLMMVSAAEVEQASARQYGEVIAQAREQGVLNRDAAQLRRVRAITDRLVAQVGAFRQDARSWPWEI